MKNIFTVIRQFVDEAWIEYYMVHLGGLVYDLFVGFMLLFRSTRKVGFLLSFLFHGMNSWLFDIGEEFGVIYFERC